MKNELTQEVSQQINAYYERIKKLLLSSASYEYDLNTENAEAYLSFVENALEKNYPRIMHIYFFIEVDTTMSGLMYPFCHLTHPAKKKIEALYYLSIWISEGLEEHPAQ